MSKRRLFAFIVGIDHFLGAGNLSGCVNDANNFKNYLEESTDPEAFELHIQTLFNEQATRKAILFGMRDHFMQATENDLALFFFAGHGSQEQAHPYFLDGRGDGMLQTIVCHDSRIKGEDGQQTRDIADKEMRYLLRKIWEKTGVEIVLIQDSCHSAGATRSADDQKELEEQEVTARYVQAKGRPIATAADFIVIEDEQERAAIEYSMNRLKPNNNTRSGGARSSQAPPYKGPIKKFHQMFPEAPHVHIAACNQNEYAYEVKHRLASGELQKGGVFTHNLLQILRATSGDISYQSLCNRIMLNIQGVFKQTPMAYAAVDNSLVFKSFLNSQNEDRKAQYSVFFREQRGKGEWLIDAGAIAGIAIPTGNQFIDNVEVLNQDGSQRYAAEIDRVFAEKSFLRFKNEEPPKDGHYYALIPQKAFYRSSVKVWIDPKGIKHPFAAYLEQKSPIRSGMQQYGATRGQAANLTANDHFLKRCNSAAEADYEVRFENGGLSLYQGPQCIYKGFDVSQADNEAIVNTLRGIASDQQKEIFFYVPEELPENPMLSIFNMRDAALYQPHIRRVEEKEKAQYWLSAVAWQKDSDSNIYYYGYQISKAKDDFPLVRQTDDLGKTSAFHTLSHFEKIANWRRARYLFNPTALNTGSMQAEFPLDVNFYIQSKAGEKEVFNVDPQKVPQPQEEQSDKARLTLRERRVSRTEYVKEFMLNVPGNYFQKDPEGDYVIHFHADIFRPTSGSIAPDVPLYYAALLLDERFGISSVTEGKVEVIKAGQRLPLMQRSNTNLQIAIPDYALSEAFQAKSAEERHLSQYFLFLVGYNRFDIAPLQQASLPAPLQPQSGLQSRLQELEQMLRSVKTYDPGEHESGWSSLMLCLRYDIPQISTLIAEAEERVAMNTDEDEEWEED